MDPVLKTKHKATQNCKHDKLKCAGCLLGKMKRRPDDSKVTKNLQEMALREDQLYPGSLQLVVDELMPMVKKRRQKNIKEVLFSATPCPHISILIIDPHFKLATPSGVNTILKHMHQNLV